MARAVALPRGLSRWLDSGHLLGCLSWILLAVLGVLLLYPLGWLVAGSELGGESFAYITRTDVVAVVWRTLSLSIAATAVSVLVGTVVAYLTTRTDLPLRGAVRSAMLLSYLTPSLFLAFAYVVLLSPKVGLLNRTLQLATGGVLTFDIFSPAGYVLLASFELTPIIYLIVSNSFASMHADLEDTALVTGGSRWHALRRVAIPLAMPGIAAGALLAFIHAASLYGVPAVLGIRVISVAIRGAFSYPFHYDRAAVLTLVLFLLAAIALLIYQATVRRQRRYATIGGRWKPPELIRLGRYKYLFGGLVLAYLFLALLAPYAILLVTALSNNWVLGISPENFTLAHFADVIGDDFRRRAITNSITFALAAATLGLLLGAGAAAVIVRGKSGPVRRMLDFLTASAWAVPSIGLGAAYVIAYLHPPVLYGTGVILIMAYTTKFFPLALRSVAAGLQQLGPEVDEAARIAGAGSLRTVRRVSMPLLRGPLLAGWVLIFAPSINELSASVLLASPGKETLAVAAMLSFESSNFETAAALGALGLAITTAIWLVVERTGARRVIDAAQ